MKSRYLVHWTGKDIDKSHPNRSSEAEHKYEERLMATLHTGLWMMPCDEFIVGPGTAFGITLPMTCFTEVLLSRSKDHVARYGRLGFGFGRNYLLRNQGAPVTYIRSHPDDYAAQRYGAVMRRIDFLDTIVNAEFGELYGAKAAAISELRDLVQQLLAFVKPMSTFEQDDFAFLEEAEWRVTYDKAWYRNIAGPLDARAFEARVQEQYRMFEHWSAPVDVRENAAGSRPPFFLQFSPDDLLLIVVPNSSIKKNVQRKPEFQDWESRRSSRVDILTFDEILSM